MIKVTVWRDDEERTVEVPKDLAAAIKKAGAKADWDKLSFTHRKEHVRAVEEAKRPETRSKRIEKAVEMLSRKRSEK
jgi:uncharacterized protein YdeI (YjbR/CyaY-like superfamily)